MAKKLKKDEEPKTRGIYMVGAREASEGRRNAIMAHRYPWAERWDILHDVCLTQHDSPKRLWMGQYYHQFYGHHAVVAVWLGDTEKPLFESVFLYALHDEDLPDGKTSGCPHETVSPREVFDGMSVISINGPAQGRAVLDALKRVSWLKKEKRRGS